MMRQECRNAGIRRAPLLLAMLVLFACVSAPQSGGTSPVLATYVAEGTDLDVLITQDGNLKPVDSVSLKSKEQGTVLSIVKEGTVVKQGEVVLQIESKEVANALTTATGDVEFGGRTLSDAQADAKLYELEANKVTGDAERVLRFSELALKQYVEGKSPLQEQTMKLAVRRAENELKDANEKLARMPDLLEKGFVTPAEARTSALETEEKKSGALSKQRELEIFLEFDRPQELAKLKADVSGAELTVERTKQQITTTRTQKQDAIRRAELNLAKRQKELAELLSRQKNLELRSPADGIVVYGDPNQQRWGQTSELNVGSDVHRNMVVMSLPNLSRMKAMAQINEINVARIAPGQKATVTVESLGRSFAGTVKEISNTAVQEWGQSSKKYLATIALEDTGNTTFKPDMSCRIEIHAARLTKVVHIPVDAVTVRQGLAWCWVAGPGDRPQRREVELGQATNERVVVSKGLAVGERVLVLAGEPDAATAATSAPSAASSAVPMAAPSAAPAAAK